MTKHDDNWTDFERPCFDDYVCDPDGDGPMECCDRDEPGECAHLAAGGTWATCSSGALSRHCPESLRPKGLRRKK